MNEIKEDEFDKRLRKIERIACLTLTGVAVIAAVVAAVDMRKTLKLVGKAADHVSDLTIVDVEQTIIDRAIGNATNREVGRAVSKAVRSLEESITEETQKRVRAAVEQNYGKLSKTVTEAIAREAAKVDKDDVMREATERAKDLIVERFDGKLDGLLEDYNRNLDNVGKIYQSIASSMTGKPGKDVTLKLG
jgi:hypothetical protein